MAHELYCSQGLTAAVLIGEGAEIEDGITDELSWSVEGYVAAAVAFENLDAPRGKLLGRGAQVGGAGVASQGDDRGMLEQQQCIGDAVLFAQFDERVLQLERGFVIDEAELEDVHQDFIPHGLKPNSSERLTARINSCPDTSSCP